MHLEEVEFKSKLEQTLSQYYESTNLDVPLLAELLGLHTRTLHRYCISYFGESPVTIITRFRIDKAKLLFQEGLKTKDVALKTGYRTEGAFRKAFRKVAGVSPGRFKDELAVPEDNNLLNQIEEIFGRSIDPCNDVQVKAILREELAIALPQRAVLNESL